ncbi:PHOsphatase, partial [Entomortierella beljakovae]
PSEKLYPVSKGNLLSASGDSDLHRIGRRFATRYEDFLDRYPYDANTYEFQSSFKSRSRQSAYAFSVGLLNGRHSSSYPGETITSPIQPVDIFTLPIGLDKELAVKYACPRWLDNIKARPNVAKEKMKYQERFLPELADKLSALFSKNDELGRVNITTKDVESIYGICGFEVSLYNNDQTWCQLLLKVASDSTLDNIEIQRSNFLNLEISSDLDDYYSYGPGIPFNRHLGCNLATSLSNAIEKALSSKMDSSPLSGDDEEDGPLFYRGLFKFGHSESILFLSSFLGLYNQQDIPLTGDMTPEQYSQREFRTSKISPFAANIGFEVYHPKLKSDSKMRIEYDKNQQEPLVGYSTPKGLIRLLVNEVPTVIPGCGSEYFCQWKTFKSILGRLGPGCNFDECCKSNDSEKTPLMRSGSNDKNPACLSTKPVTKT